MNKSLEQFADTGKANLQALEGLALQAHAGIEKLVELNLAATKAALSESFTHVQTLLSAKDPQAMMALQSGLVQSIGERSAAYFQHLQGILATTGADFMKSLEAQSASTQKNFSSLVEGIAKNAPAGSESAMSFLNNAMNATQDAFKSAQSSAKQAVDAAQSNFSSATTQTVDAVKKATKSA